MTTLARQQVAQYTNVLSRYNKDPNTPTLTAAQIRLMVDRFSVVRKAEPPPVFPDPKQMAKYEQTIKRRVVNPLFRNLRSGLNEAQSIRQAHAALNGITLPATSIPLIEQDVDQYFKKLDKQNNQEMYRSFRDALGVDIRQELAIVDTTATLNQFRRENIELIRTIPSTLHQDLYERMTATFAEKPFSRAAMGKLVREQYGASGYNARRLARDQTSKIAGQLNKVRQTGVGIEQYKWRTSQDNRVRPSHAAHEGKLFDWENPPAGTGHPGTDVNCRCSGQPEVPEALVAKWPKVKPKSKLKPKPAVNPKAVPITGPIEGVEDFRTARIARRGRAFDHEGLADYVDIDDVNDRASMYFSPDYRKINEPLRSAKALSKETKQTVAGIQQQMKPLSQNVRVYRGDDFLRDYKKGQVFDDQAFLSTSTEPSQALRFATRTKTEPQTLVEFVAPKGTKAIVENEWESEIVFDIGTRFRVREALQDFEYTREVRKPTAFGKPSQIVTQKSKIKRYYVLELLEKSPL